LHLLPPQQHDVLPFGGVLAALIRVMDDKSALLHPFMKRRDRQFAALAGALGPTTDGASVDTQHDGQICKAFTQADVGVIGSPD